MYKLETVAVFYVMKSLRERERKKIGFLLEKGNVYFQLCLGKHSTRWQEEVQLE